MALIPDLNFILNHGYYHGFTEITLTNKIPFNFDLSTRHHIIKIIKVGKSWKSVDEWGNHWTISTAPKMIQSVIYSHLKQMFDKREKLDDIDYKDLSFNIY